MLEASSRVLGRVQTAALADGTRVDLGASYLHDCRRHSNLYNLARKSGVALVTEAVGAVGWGEGAAWLGDDGAALEQPTVARAFRIMLSVVQEIWRLA